MLAQSLKSYALVTELGDLTIDVITGELNGRTGRLGAVGPTALTGAKSGALRSFDR